MPTEISLEWKEKISRFLPALQEGVSLEYTSPVDPNYNCLAWALSNSSHVFENAKGAFWPWRYIADDTAEGWAQVCEIFGFTRTDTAEFVKGYEKIAILEVEVDELHATRQDKNGKWKSKLGVLGPDIDHEGLGGLEAAYGRVVVILQKRRPDWDEQG